MMANLTVVEEFLSLCSNSSSDGNSTSELWLVRDRVTGQVSAAFLLLILVVGLPWNLLVVLTIVKEKLYHQPTIVLLLNLVLNDIVMLVLLLPFDIAVGFSGEFIFGRNDFARCKACQLGIVNIIFFLMSVYTISFMAFDRFLFIYKPLRYDKILTSTRVGIILAVMWIILIIISILGFGKLIFHPYFITCQLDFTFSNGYYPSLMYTFFCVPVLALVVFNIWVVVIVQKNIRAIYGVRKSKDRKKSHDSDDISKTMRKERHKKELHLIRVFGGLLCSNMLSWLPLIVLALYIFITMAQSNIPIAVVSTCRVLFASQLTLHPILETALIKDVREPLKKIAFYFCLRRKAEMLSDHSFSSERQKRVCVCDCFHGDDMTPRTCCGCGFLALLNSSILLGHHSNSAEGQSHSVEDRVGHSA